MSIDFRGVAPLLQVFDMPAAVHFYRERAWFRNRRPVSAHRTGRRSFRLGAAQVRGLRINADTAYEEDQRPPQPDPARVAAHGDTCLYFGCEDLDGAYQHLRKHGLNIREPKVAPYGMRQLYVADPGGYALCFQWPVSQQRYNQWVEAYGLEPKTVG